MNTALPDPVRNAVNDSKSRWVIEQVQARAAALEDQLAGLPASAVSAWLLSRMWMIARIPSPAHHHRTAGSWSRRARLRT